MKRNSIVLAVVLLLTVLLSSCGGEILPEVWEDATYTSDKTLGEGSKTVTLDVSAADKSIVFTLKTDESTLGAALLALGLIEGENGQYGIYITSVNGIVADYDKDGTWWCLNSISGDTHEMMMSGVDTTGISGGEHFELVLTK